MTFNTNPEKSNNGGGYRFKPYYTWMTFNTEDVKRAAKLMGMEF